MFAPFIKHSTLVASIVGLLSVANPALSRSSHALTVDLSSWDIFGDAISEENQAILTNASSDGFDDLDETSSPVNFNVSGNEPVFGFDLELELGLPDGSLGFDSGESSALLTQTLTVEAGEVLQFNWNFLTNHEMVDSRNDFAFISINDSVFRLADTNSPFSFPGERGFSRQTGFNTFSYTFPTAGEYTIGIGVIDVGDDITTSALVLETTIEDIPEPSAILSLLALGTLGVGSAFKCQRQPKSQQKDIE